jgi:hypothetical protein
MDIWDGIIVGAAAAAIGTIVAYKFLNPQPVGGMQPLQPMEASYNATSGGSPAPLYVLDLNLPSNMAPLQQTNPITEAAYNQYPVPFEHAFGPAVNQPNDDAVVSPM